LNKNKSLHFSKIKVTSTAYFSDSRPPT